MMERVMYAATHITMMNTMSGAMTIPMYMTGVGVRVMYAMGAHMMRHTMILMIIMLMRWDVLT